MDDQANRSKRAAGQIKVDLGVETKRAWVEWCEERALVPGKVLRTLVEKALADGLEPAVGRSGAEVRVVITEQPDDARKVRREIQLTPSEDAAIAAVAQAQSFRFQAWVVAAVRAALTAAPSYGRIELEELTASNERLAAIAGDLAVLRSKVFAGEFVEADALRGLEREIRVHVETVSATMAQGARRWKLTV